MGLTLLFYMEKNVMAYLAEFPDKLYLEIPKNTTHSGFVKIGKSLVSAGEKLQWYLGDYYNALPEGESKKKICEEAGLNYSSLMNYGVVCRAFPKEDRIAALSFHHHQKAAPLDAGERIAILQKTVREKWKLSRFHLEVKLAKGEEQHPEETKKVEQITDHFKPVMDALPKSTTAKTKRGIKKVLTDLGTQFHAEVQEEVRKKTQDQRARLNRIEEDYKAKEKVVTELRKKIHFFMTYEEYRLIIACLHPDRAPAERRKQFQKAFQIFKRLGEAVELDRMPLQNARNLGWEKKHPRYKGK